MKNAPKWFFGIVFLMAGLGGLVSGSIAAGLIYLAIGLITLPPSLNAIEQAGKFNIPSVGKYAIVIGGMFIAAPLLKTDRSKYSNSSSSNTIVTTTQPEVVPKEVAVQKEIGVGDVLATDYFAIKVNSATLNKRVWTGDDFTSLKQEQGIEYLIVDVTFKNIDSESRMIIDGSVFIQYGGKMYEYDKSETILADGWGLLLDQINPLTTKRTKLVYKLPSEISGPAYYRPGRNSNDNQIFLGNLN
jgi:hypothetical protein